MEYALVADDHAMFAAVPRLYGYDAFAREVGLQASTIRGYYLNALRRGAWDLIPRPDYLLMRTADRPLPCWTMESIRTFRVMRVGPGNVTAERREVDRRRRGVRSVEMPA